MIADDGSGFPPYVLEQLGEPFVTTRPAHSFRQEAPDEHIGMGLGFFIAKTLLERSGATLALANRPQPQGGAVVTVAWPRSRFERMSRRPSSGASLRHFSLVAERGFRPGSTVLSGRQS